ncbi:MULTISPECIES: MBL fold metallo-hydrolase [Salipiger]|uniref:Zn-dependent hydrolase, glyoxylase n=1 Tax=Salipiger profundus TaxID=1229727 RepID=A0A1U7DDN9_9RHOB|nr:MULTISPECIES: MBL fold metallo-hydrolase [Salipiger]APX26165.1 Zn-dependent hydrolase, glyoxylase [Salipiger profundus]GGA23541.1 MBL fold metallo-hydrolase [Salipiger profundus]
MTQIYSPYLSRRHLLLAGAATLAGGLMPRTALAEAPPLGGTVPGWYRFGIGDIEATIISDGLLNLGSANDQFPNAPQDDIARIMKEEFLPADPMMLEQNCLVLNIANRVVLFDSGIGSDQTFGDKAGRMLRNLQAAGIEPGQVDDVVLTHAHCDHCWGLVADDGALNFPNATVHISQVDFDYWTDEANLSGPGFIPFFVAGARKNLLPYRDRLSFVADGKEVMPGVTAISTPGHTPGHISYVIASGGQTFLNVGDVVHHYALLFENPGWRFAFDSDPGMAAETRLKLFDMAASEEMPMIGYHFPFPGLGNIRREGSAYAYVPIPMVHA